MSDQAPPAHKPLIDEVLRKVGRNLVIYQQIELMLKALANWAPISGTLFDVTAEQEKRRSQLSKMGMGQAMEYALRALGSSPTKPPAQATADTAEVWMAISVELSGGETLAATIQPGIDAMRVQRNRLVHHLLEDWEMLSPTSCSVISSQLDTQRVAAMEVHERLKHYIDALADIAREHLAAWEPGGAGDQALRMHSLQHDPTVARLVAIVADDAAHGGWVDMSTAGRKLRERDSSGLDELLSSQKLKGLGQLVARVGLFEERVEPTPNGTRRMIRLKTS